MSLTKTDRANLDAIKAKWESIKGDTSLTGSAGAFSIAMWAAINVDYLIALAERNDRP